MSRRFTLHLLAYLVPTFALGFVWHLIAFGAYYRALEIYRPAVIVPLGFLSMVVQGAVVALVYPRLVDRPDTLAGGLRFAGLAAALSWSFTTLAVAAKHPMTSIAGFVAIETAFTIVQYALVGPLLAVASRMAAASPRRPVAEPAR